ncbi:Zinc finger MYM-type protein 1 [Stylophora pistillata]|uniref:Zinc finger MYM-type protein 1 n=1 Tax=Stylophora pistillata TaxID=50429 RepID=A0A2B4R829_STYPI|nr:Zinc finger MYM-type protein 1 [Stylophora pistillata]
MLKYSKIDAEDVGSDLQNDNSTDIVDSLDTAPDKSEIELIQVNNGVRRAPGTSEFMDVGVTDESEIMDKGNSDKSEIMAMENIHNSADNGACAADTTEIVDNGANSEIVRSADRHMFISVVIDNSVLEKSQNFALNGTKKEAFIGLYSTKSTEGEVLYELVKSAITELNHDLKNIVAKAFDGAANVNGVPKGLSTRMEECSPLGIYVHCCRHVLNLALQDTMTQIEPLRNALGTIQALYNFLEASPKRHTLFNDTEVQGKDLKLTLNSLTTIRWSCRWEAAKANGTDCKSLLIQSSDKDPKTYSESRALFNAICDLEFVFGLCVLKVILCSTNSLCRYLQGKTVDVISARRNADLTIQTLRQCRSEESFKSVWQLASPMGLKMKNWLTNSQFELRETRAPRQTPPRRLQALVGEHAQRQTQTPESHHRINTYYASIDKVLSELELRFSGNDQEILCKKITSSTTACFSSMANNNNQRKCVPSRMITMEGVAFNTACSCAP